MKDDKSCGTGKLSVCNLAVSLGVVWGLYMLVITYMAMSHGLGVPFVQLFSSIYKGMAMTWVGAFTGFGWGFLNGFIFGGLLAYVHNFCACKCPCKICTKCRK